DSLRKGSVPVGSKVVQVKGRVALQAPSPSEHRPAKPCGDYRLPPKLSKIKKAGGSRQESSAFTELLRVAFP
ncbi:MAG: hypothetical protein RR954_08710, partial [Christensenellaceae bacterium]